MITYNSLKEKFDKDIMKLQKRCKHKDLSNWMEEQWAPAHCTGRQVKVCNICNKVVKTKEPKDIEEEEIITSNFFAKFVSGDK